MLSHHKSDHDIITKQKDENKKLGYCDKLEGIDK